MVTAIIKKFRKLAHLPFLLFLPLFSSAQIQLCGTKDPIGVNPKVTLQIEGIIEDTVTYRVPVVFTVIGDAQDIFDVNETILSDQLRIMNEDFRAHNSDIASLVPPFVPVDSKIEFYKAKPTRKITNGGLDYDSAHQFDMYKAETGGAPIVDSVLNIYFCNFSFAGGFAVFPRSNTVRQYYDACSIRIRSFLGTGRRIATHEIGHWLDCPHTFQPDSICNGQPRNYGDGFSDTPPLLGSTSGCPLNRLSCVGTKAFVQNFMDYSSCLVAFSNDQRSAMRNVLRPGGIRSYLSQVNPPKPPNTLPVCIITSPLDSARIPVGTVIRYSVTATDDKEVTKVEAFLNGSLLTTFTRPPYSFTFTPQTAQTVTFGAKAYDSEGFTIAKTVRIFVTQTQGEKVTEVILEQNGDLRFKTPTRERVIPK